MTEWWNEHENSPVPGTRNRHPALLQHKQRPSQTAEEIAQAIGVPRSSVYRFLLSLKGAGLVEQEPQSGRYTLGLKLLELGEIVHGRLDLERVAAPLIKELARRCGETVELIVPYDDHGMCIYAEESSSPLRLSPGRGQRLPLYIGASEQVLLAWLPEGGEGAGALQGRR